VIGYGLSTMPGESGTPVCVNEEIIAIHNGGGKKDEEFNVGRLVTADMIINLNKWCKDLNAVPFTQVPDKVCTHSKEKEMKMEEKIP
jgi:hypothetical protein